MTDFRDAAKAFLSNQPMSENHTSEVMRAYAAIVPKVVEAWAMMKCGKTDEAMKAVEAAKLVIDMASRTSSVWQRYEMTDDERRQEAEMERSMMHGQS